MFGKRALTYAEAGYRQGYGTFAAKMSGTCCQVHLLCAVADGDGGGGKEEAGISGTADAPGAAETKKAQEEEVSCMLALPSFAAHKSSVLTHMML